MSTPAVSVLSVKQAIGLSDHRVQIADIDVVVQRPSATFRWLRPFRRCCWDDVRDYLSSAPWSTMEIYDDPDDMWGFFCQIVTSCLDKFVPLQKVRSKYSKRSTPWITPEVLSAIKEKQRAKRAAELSGSSESLALYKQLKNKLKTVVQSAKLHCLQVLLQQSRKCSHLAA